MFEPDHIFDARGPAKLIQNPVCQDLQIGLKKGPKMAPEAVSEHQLKVSLGGEGLPLAAVCFRTQSRTRLHGLTMLSVVFFSYSTIDTLVGKNKSLISR